MSITSNTKMNQLRLRRLQGSIPASYTIFQEAGVTYAEACKPGLTDDNDEADPDPFGMIQHAIGSLTTGKIFIHDATYLATGGVLNLKDKQVKLVGESRVGTILKRAGAVVDMTNTVELQYGQQGLSSLTLDGVDHTGIGLDIEKARRSKFDDILIQHCLQSMRLTDVGLCTFLHTYQRSSTSGLLIRTFDAADWSHGNQFIVGEVQDCNPGVQIVGNSNGNCFSMVIEGIADELIKLETLMIGGDEYIPLFNRFTKCWVEGVTPNCELIDMVTGAGGAKRPRSTIFHNNIFSSAADFKLNILGDYGRFTDNIIKGATAIPTCTITTGGVEGANAVTGTTVPVPAEIVLVWTNLMANTRWENNQGFTSKNENYGTGSIENGHSADIITHGLSYTPDPAEVTINGREDPTNSIGTVWVDNCTDTTFQVNCENDPGASNWDFVWSVRRIYL